MTTKQTEPALDAPPAGVRKGEVTAAARNAESDSAAYAACGRGSIVGLALFGALVAGLAWPTVRELVPVWQVDENYSHGFVVPFVSLLFVALAWPRYGSPLRRDATRGSLASGTAEIAAGLMLHFGAWFAGVLLFDVLGLILVLRGSLLVMGGETAVRAYGFAALFLIFMAPLPMAWYQPLAISLQKIVSVLSTTMLEVCGVAAYRDGYHISMPGYTMEVAEACSGLRQLTAILALGIAIGHLGDRPTWFRWALGLLSIPIAIIANCIRVTLTGFILIWFGREWAEGTFHTLEGLAIVGLSALLIVGTAWLLVRMDEWRRGRSTSAQTTAKSA